MEEKEEEDYGRIGKSHSSYPHLDSTISVAFTLNQSISISNRMSS